jgi:hypothetical protein
MDLATNQPTMESMRRTHGPRTTLPPASSRMATIQRLITSGMPRDLATAWIAIWDESTRDLVDFRSASDFWSQGYEYAVEEYRRGYRPSLTAPDAGRLSDTRERPR